MDPTCNEEARAFVEEILRTGFTLTDVLGGLVEALQENGSTGEDAAEDLIEMVTGTILPAANAAGPNTVRKATALLGAVSDRVKQDLLAARDRASDP